MKEALVGSVQLPPGVDLDPSDRELVAKIAETIAVVRQGSHRDSDETVRRLTADGWDVSARVGWIVEARRGSVHERTAGVSRAEALKELRELTLLDAVDGCP